MCRFINISNNCFISNNCLSNIREVLTQTKKMWNMMDFFKSQACIWMWVWDILVPRTLGPWDSWTSYLLQQLLILPLTSSYLFLLLSSFGMVWLWEGGGGGVLTLEMDLRPLYWSPGTSSFLLHSLPLTSSHLLLIPPSYSTLLPNLLLTPPTSSWRVSDD